MLSNNLGRRRQRKSSGGRPRSLDRGPASGRRKSEYRLGLQPGSTAAIFLPGKTSTETDDERFRRESPWCPDQDIDFVGRVSPLPSGHQEVSDPVNIFFWSFKLTSISVSGLAIQKTTRPALASTPLSIPTTAEATATSEPGRLTLASGVTWTPRMETPAGCAPMRRPRPRSKAGTGPGSLVWPEEVIFYDIVVTPFIPLSLSEIQMDHGKSSQFFIFSEKT